MDSLIDVFKNIQENRLVEIWGATALFVLLLLIAPIVAKIIISMCMIQSKKKINIKLNPFYTALVVAIRMLSVYFLLLISRRTVEIDPNIELIINKGILIVAVISISKALLKNCNVDSPVAKNILHNSKKEMKESMLNFVLKTIRVLIYTVAGIIVMTTLGLNVTSIITGLGFGSVLITLSAQDTAKNLFGGLMIFLDKPFEVGDWISTDKYEGTVEDVSFRSTRIRTIDDSIANVPNSVITNGVVINSSKLEKRRFKTVLEFSPKLSIQKMETFKCQLYDVLCENDSIIKGSIRLVLNRVQTTGSQLEITLYVDTKEHQKYLEVEEVINYSIINIIDKLEMLS